LQYRQPFVVIEFLFKLPSAWFFRNLEVHSSTDFSISLFFMFLKCSFLRVSKFFVVWGWNARKQRDHIKRNNQFIYGCCLLD
ncbi:hypothetical protein L9F63_016603, partial [Diploptera punctata]